MKIYKKLNISLPSDLHAWCVKKQKEEQMKTEFGRVGLSNIIAKAVQKMMDAENNSLPKVSPVKCETVQRAPISSASLKHRKTKQSTQTRIRGN